MMSLALQRIVLPLLLLAGALAAGTSLAAMDGRAAVAPPAPRPAPFLTSAQLSALAGGSGPALADLYWIRAAGVSSGELDGPGAVALYDLLDRVTALDPRFEPAYHFGALLLSIAGRRPDLSDRLLERAQGQFPRAWSFPFYLGFNAFYHRTDFPAAARYLGRAAALPGAPPFLGELARRFGDEAQGRAGAREVIGRMLRVTDDPVIRRRLIERLRELEGDG
jgi:hypothetical protein